MNIVLFTAKFTYVKWNDQWCGLNFKLSGEIYFVQNIYQTDTRKIFPYSKQNVKLFIQKAKTCEKMFCPRANAFKRYKFNAKQ